MWHISREYKDSNYKESSPQFFNKGEEQEFIKYFNDDPKSLITSFIIKIYNDHDKIKRGMISEIKHIVTEDNKSLKKLFSAIRSLKYSPDAAKSKKMIDLFKEQEIIPLELHETILKQLNYCDKEEKSTPQSCIIH